VSWGRAGLRLGVGLSFKVALGVLRRRDIPALNFAALSGLRGIHVHIHNLAQRTIMTKKQKALDAAVQKSRTAADEEHAQQDNGSGAQQEQNGKQNNAAGLGEIAFKVPKNFFTEYRRSQTEDNGFKKNQRLVNWLTFFALVIYAGLTGWQSSSTKGILDTTHTQFERDQRAWVGFTYSIVNIDDVGKSAITTYIIKNVGHAPAFNVCPTASLLRYDGPVTPEFDWQAVARKMHEFTDYGECGFTLLTGETYDKKRGYLNGWLVQPDDRKNLIAGTLTIIFVGRITYKDSFGGQHTTTYCRRLEAGYQGMDDRMFFCNLNETAD
jgi:hypothetical protein